MFYKNLTRNPQFRVRRAGSTLCSFAFLVAIAGIPSFAQTTTRNPPRNTTADANSSPLVIETITLPRTYPRTTYAVHLQAHGGVPTLHWRLESGELPAGLELDDDGTLRGVPQKAGDYTFTLSVHDSNRPERAVQREYQLKITAAISMQWSNPAHVSGNRIDGSVIVSNSTADEWTSLS